MNIGGWGNYPTVEGRLSRAADEEGLRGILAREETTIARGAGRAYGDAALNDHVTLFTTLDRILAFDPASGKITCEAGVTFDTLARLFLPRGWFVPVTPGTRFVTLGGAVAADVHGKNHHVSGSFGNHVEAFTLMDGTGQLHQCSRQENPDLFSATIGGMGLTGFILTVTFAMVRVESARIVQQTVRARGISEIMDLFEEGDAFPFSVAWIDCVATGGLLGRSVMMRGWHARRDELPKGIANPLRIEEPVKISVPFFFPGFALNRVSVSAFNALYYALSPARPTYGIIPADPFFYPLDAVYHWNRIYGRRGFVQYQFVLPKAASRKGLPMILKAIAASGLGSFLAVLKLFGPGNGGLSFPLEGFTLALDFPATPEVFALLARLDRMVHDHGGRLYLAKDARTAPAMVAAGYPQLASFLDLCRTLDPLGRFSSQQARRLGLV